MRFITKAAALAATTIVMTATAASASVSFDPTTGTGFVGKGDVQIAFGWNNQKLQSNAGGVTFSYDAVDTYDVTCEWDTSTGSVNSPNGTSSVHHSIEIPRHNSIRAALDGDPRQTKGQKQFTGFILKGWDGEPVFGGSGVPVVGGACPGQSDVAVITAVDQVESVGGLSATYDGKTVPLEITPVL